MKNMKVSRKLISSFLIVAILAAVVGVVGIYGLFQLNNSMTSMYYDQTVPMPSLSKVVEMLQRQRANMREYIVGAALNDVELIQNAHARVLDQRAVIQEEIPRYRATIKSDETF